MPQQAAELQDNPTNQPYDEAETGGSRLEELARASAAAQPAAAGLTPGLLLADYLDDYEKIIQDAVRHFQRMSEQETFLPYSAEWLLDNHYIVNQALREVREDYPYGYARQLPRITAGELAGQPRVYALARDLIIFEKASLDMERVRRFTGAYQSTSPLTMGELWAVPIMLRLGIIQTLVFALIELTRDLEEPGAVERSIPLIDLGADVPLDERVAACIVSLRALAAEDWKDFFESLSHVERILRREPANLYAGMDFETRDRYRKAVEELAMAAGRSEQDVAREAVRLAQSRWDDALRPSGQNNRRGHLYSEQIPYWDGFTTRREEHVGYYLVDEGRKALEESLAFRPRGLQSLRRWIFAHPGLFYGSLISLLTLLLIALLLAFLVASQATFLQRLGAVLLALIPAVNLAVTLAIWLVTHFVPPRVLPRMDFSRAIPPDCTTLVTIPALISSPEELDSLLQQIEIHYLRNQDNNLLFGLLTDFNDADSQHLDGDDELLQAAGAGIEALNRKYGRGSQHPFYLFHRERRWNEKERIWMGWERKRGKLQELNRLILGRQDTSFTRLVGNLSRLADVRYVITLDADTALHRSSAAEMVATLAHPLNRPEFDTSGRVTAGYTILQPRTEISAPSANRSLFTRIFAGDTGLDLYTLAVSDVYQDLFGEGIFVGKGIYDVAAFERSLEGRVPENALLSHDLFEGIHGRAGLVTDIVLIEDYPPSYLAYVSRLHRWIRGDWQILPWLFPTVPAQDGKRIRSRLSLINRWKILDNLRRSLSAPALLLFFAAAWAALPGSPWMWTLLGSLTLAGPLLTGVLSTVLGVLRGASMTENMHSLRQTALRWLLSLAFLPFESVVVLDAVLTTLVRLLLRRGGMLEWTPAALSARRWGSERSLLTVWQNMIEAPLIALLAALMLVVLRPQALWGALPLLGAWFLSPLVVDFLSRPLHEGPDELTPDQTRELRTLARQTWLFFEQFVGPEDRWLPPDHYQEAPRGIVAHRTSPTNIGLSLLAALSAYDFGYVGMLNLVSRLQVTFETLEKLERYRGHFLNWYDTRTLEPLQPRYVSTVDSGNLAACLLALGQGCLQVPGEPVLRWETWDGLLDLLRLLRREVQQAGEDDQSPDSAQLQSRIDALCDQISAQRYFPERWAGLVTLLLEEHIPALELALVRLVEAEEDGAGSESLRRLRIYSRNVRRHLESARREVEVLVPWLVTLDALPLPVERLGPDLGLEWERLRAELSTVPTLQEIPLRARTGLERLAEFRTRVERAGLPAEAGQALLDWANRLGEQLSEASYSAKALMIGFETLYRQANEMVQEMNFSFLFNSLRKVFHIGYNHSLGRLDSNFYDLLASEARIASLVAIAKGDVPYSHWLHLARPVTRIDGTQVLLSWSATMFEYLMPLLVLRSYEGTLLDHTMKAVAGYQIEYGRKKRVPWGISESGYYRFDENQNYQYRAFGVPGLGFKRGLGDDLVITPYASLLALPLQPQAVIDNLRDLRSIHMLGIYGLYEAVDFTSTRLPLGRDYEIVRSYMAHHQGMILLSIANTLKGNVMVQRLHAHPLIQSVDLLLQEQIPQNPPVEQPQEAQEMHMPPAEPVIAQPWAVPVESFQPRVHVLSNGRYSVLIDNSGGGRSTWKDFELTRWRADTTLNNWGTWFYIQDTDSGRCWSPTVQPLGEPPDEYAVRFSPQMAEFRSHVEDISAVLEVAVAPDDDVEVRLLTLTNHSSRPRRLQVVSYAEVSLAAGGDERHPAYNKLFIESEWHAELNGLIFRRRLRKSTEEPVFLIHFLTTGPQTTLSGRYESDRLRFLGRGRTARRPQTLFDRGGLSGTTGATLDPVLSLGQEIHIEPHDTRQLAFLTLAASSRAAAVSAARRYASWHQIERAFDRARSQAEVELRRLHLSTPQLEVIQKLLSVLVYPCPGLRAPGDVLAANRLGQPGLWPFGISGDDPILLVRVSNADELVMLQEVLTAHRYWRSRGMRVDLVVLNEQGTDYGQELQNLIHRLLHRTASDAWLQRRGGIYILLRDQLSAAQYVLLQTAARAVLTGSGGALRDQLAVLDPLPTYLPPFTPAVQEAGSQPSPLVSRPAELLFDNGYGGFSPDGREYQIYLEPGRSTPAPWVNVIANPDFGFLVSESALNATWAINSGENRLTPWSNDPVSDLAAEAVYLRDEETGEVWTPTPLPAGEDAPYLVRHGAGYTIFEHGSHGMKQTLRLFASAGEPLKFVQLRLENTWERTRRLTVTYYAPWVLGLTHEQSQMYVVTSFHDDPQALLVRNTYNIEFGEQVAFAAACKNLHSLTADRTEFLGRNGSLQTPAGLRRIGLSGAVGAGMDPCAALQLHIDLHPGEVEEVYFLLGEAAGEQEALALVRKYQDPDAVTAAWEKLQACWDRILGSVQVRTPDRSLDLMLNRFLLYQSLACRIWGRTAFYQSSGAYGFRDQLQDVMALIFAAPQEARAHILRAARHQFEAGDVLHWWHPPSGRGIRTRMSDDLLWLPYVTAYYVKATGDVSILNEEVPFLQAPLLEPGEEERYGQYPHGEARYTLYEHCRRAIDKGVTSGAHGLPLIGTGDWNDGMNRVGIEGKGESVWLGWFIYDTLMRFAETAECLQESTQAAAYRQRAERLKEALEAHAWDGNWYLRAYYDDGTPLGSAQNQECQIDAIAQSWAVLSGAGDPERTQRAMQAVSERLVRIDDGLILLFTPPFNKTPRDPGYIKGYLPGIRENGGQYTHAAIWTVWAFRELGQAEYTYQLYRLLNPVLHADTPEKAGLYKVEPYVIAADIYGVPPHVGRGGWTWYTGSSGWMYRLGLEGVLGLRRLDDHIRIDPSIPADWPGYELWVNLDGARYHVQVENPQRVSRGVRQVFLDGQPLRDALVPLRRAEVGGAGADGDQHTVREHHVRVILGSGDSPAPEA